MACIARVVRHAGTRIQSGHCEVTSYREIPYPDTISDNTKRDVSVRWIWASEVCNILPIPRKGYDTELTFTSSRPFLSIVKLMDIFQGNICTAPPF